MKVKLVTRRQSCGARGGKPERGPVGQGQRSLEAPVVTQRALLGPARCSWLARGGVVARTRCARTRCVRLERTPLGSAASAAGAGARPGPSPGTCT